MKRRGKKWKLVAVGIGVLCLLLSTQCHLVMPPLRRADAVIQIKTTGYCACSECCSWKLNWLGLPVYAAGPNKGKLKIIGRTASGRMARPATVAVDPSVFPIGTRFYIPGYGWGIAEDTGGAIKGRHLDLFFWRHQTGRDWGVQNKQVKVWYPKD
jgi:3D (Asp-Asp-Asp) domain-containing protein